MTVLINLSKCRQCGKHLHNQRKATVTFEKQRVEGLQVELNLEDGKFVCEPCRLRVMMAAMKDFAVQKVRKLRRRGRDGKED